MLCGNRSTREPDFAAECKRQSELASQADSAELRLLGFMDEVLPDMGGWAA
ncbi:MAG: DUF3018 family protein [Hylemonella sp.]|nr:DUF3018 family protein [Hylemonella sp.]